MQTSLKGHALPENEEEFKLLSSRRQVKYLTCFDCHKAFSPANTHSRLGWMETQISGACEDCFDALFAEGGSPA